MNEEVELGHTVMDMGMVNIVPTSEPTPGYDTVQPFLPGFEIKSGP
jgi:hypothetical protein